LAELTRITVAEALASREYPLLLRDRRMRWPEATIKSALMAAAIFSTGLHILVSESYGLRSSQTLLTKFGLAAAWLMGFGLLYVLRIEASLLLSAEAIEARLFNRRLVTFAWREHQSVSIDGDDLMLSVLGKPGEKQALFAGIFGMPPGEEPFGARLADLVALLETHRAANTTPHS